ncbi:putative dehydrogenase [Motilibacter rhizosphaerae]|uniref:Putative dehydrogenase n=1 Tax=Motilibacter rhizosphaerae TaxID=598652 RepID=A0A4Q7NAU6_9ACTN|nr:Gfo/Idh/MocA family oxidoreductase [Motilibacter rhizosphaerae]RZS80026.1 putative dehydrogenase [Motilibacter rhizosphaerae]
MTNETGTTESGSGARWGILGAGGIARAFAKDLALLDDVSIAAVGSRDQARADAFADEVEADSGLRVAHRHATYEDLVADESVDVVYVATPHPAHRDAAALALRAGKHVLVEKPFTMNAREARELVDLAREHDRFLMEAMWTRFLPHIARVREILAEGTLGQLVTLTAEHGQWFREDASHRLFAPELGGGALLDLGIYPLSFAFFAFGRPTRVAAFGTTAFTGVDAQTSMLLEHEGGRHSLLTTTLQAATANKAVIDGTEARIEIDRTYYTPTSFSVIARDGSVLERYDAPHQGHGLRHQAAEVGRRIAAGERESPLLPLDETVAIMETMDEVRRQTGLRYAADEG